MYAIFEDGSRQYRVSEGDVVRIDFREADPGSTIELQRVLLVANGGDVRIGTPTVAGAKVTAEVLGLAKEKTVIQQFRRRKNYRRLKGHTQPYLEVRVKSIG
jgi:large subunit ribosomal protein L21